MTLFSARLRPAARTVAVLAASAALAAPFSAAAQSSCSSDGVPVPSALLERFINADCESCWRDPKTPVAGRGQVALDWIIPGIRGDDAPLAAAANRDGLARLSSVGRKPPLQADATSRRAQPQGRLQLRVAHGLPFYQYVGASIELKPGSGGPWKAWLVLVETLPAGTEGSPVERNLVRNALQPDWDGALPSTPEGRRRLLESRPMGIPEGAHVDRLRVVGWVEDARGRIRAIAESRCAPEGTRG
jgi:hypothetical protein